MIACYVRVSTEDQNVASQLREIERWLEGNGVTGAEWFIDKLSGDTLDRPEFERLQRAIFDGQVRTVVVYKLDRLSRSLRDGINVLSDWCERGVRVVSVTQQIDLSGTVGKMIAAVLFAVAEMEQETRRERQAAGIAVAKREGKYKGRRAGTFKANPVRVRELKERGLSVREIGSAMGVSVMTVRRYLRGGA